MDVLNSEIDYCYLHKFLTFRVSLIASVDKVHESLKMERTQRKWMTSSEGMKERDA